MSNVLRVTGLQRYVSHFEPSVADSSLFLSLALLLAIVLVRFHSLSQRSQDAGPKGCRKIGLRTQSHLTDEYHKRYHVPAERFVKGTTRAAAKVKSLWIYPIKSCRGIEVNRSTIVSTGMEYDRLFCFAQLKSPFPVSLNTPDEEKSKHEWEFLTQRRFSSMALIETEVWVPDPSLPTYSAMLPEVQSGGIVVIKYPSIVESGLFGTLSNIWVAMGGKRPGKAVRIPLNPTAEQIKENSYVLEPMKIWKDTPQCLNLGTTIAPASQPWLEELQTLIGCTNPLALFRISSDDLREVYRCAPRKEAHGWQPKVTFTDAYPLHIMNLASVRDVGSKVRPGSIKLSARRFRPNIIFTGLEAYAEDKWKRIQIGGYEYHVSCRTVRCLLPNVDPTTGEKHRSEPNRTLKSFRCIDEGDIKNACLGMQMVPVKEEGQINVGDVIEDLETGDHLYIQQ